MNELLDLRLNYFFQQIDGAQYVGFQSEQRLFVIARNSGNGQVNYNVNAVADARQRGRIAHVSRENRKICF